MEEVFKSLGFSEREIKIYLALLELGQSTVGPIASKTKIQHSKVYQTLEKLIDKGLVNYIIKSKTKFFQAQDPKQIMAMIKEKEVQFKEILPKLQEKQKFSMCPQTAIVYEGYKAIKFMFNVLLEELHKKSYYYAFVFKEEYLFSETASTFLRQIHMNLAEKKVEDKLIAHISIKKEFKKNYSNIKNLKCRFMSINLPLGLMVIDDRVINWVWGERPTAIEIVSKQISEQYKKFFLELWKIAKR